MTSIRGPRPAHPRPVARFGAVLTGALVVAVVAAAPVAALERDDGDDPGEQLSTLESLALFGVLPIALMLLIALLVCLPSLIKGPRNKPGINWDAQPEWYGGPQDEAQTPAVAGSGTQQALTGRVVSTGAEGDADDGGGSSARW